MSLFLKRVKAMKPRRVETRAESKQRTPKQEFWGGVLLSKHPSHRFACSGWQSGIPVPWNSLGSVLSLAAADEVVKAGLNYTRADGI